MSDEQDFLAHITVKCPAVLSFATVDYVTQIPLFDLVEDLKRQLSRVHPCRPEVEDQRLIFRGHILNDKLTIAEMCEKVFSRFSLFILIRKSRGSL
jgi:hypothetical protein